MRTSALAFIAVLCLFLSEACFCQTPAAQFEAFLTAAPITPDKAVDDLFVDSALGADKLASLKAQLKAMLPLYGVPLGFEKILENDISPSLKRLVYLQKFDRTGLLWVIYFYHPKDKWIANFIQVSDEFPKVFSVSPKP